MVREITSVSSFRTGLPGPSRNSRRSCSRRLPFVLVAATLLFALVVLVRQSSTEQAARSAADLEGADQELLKVLVRTKEALEDQTDWRDIAAYADRAKVLMVRLHDQGLRRARLTPLQREQDLDEFGTTLNDTYANLNASTQALYSRSVQHHHQSLLQEIYPYINKSPQIPRTLAGVRLMSFHLPSSG